jgi:hypothetical protein
MVTSSWMVGTYGIDIPRREITAPADRSLIER